MGTPHTWGPLEIGDGYFGILSEFLKGLNDFFYLNLVRLKLYALETIFNIFCLENGWSLQHFMIYCRCSLLTAIQRRNGHSSKLFIISIQDYKILETTLDCFASPWNSAKLQHLTKMLFFKPQSFPLHLES